MKTILVVEDEVKVRKNICDLIESENYSVECAVNGKEGLIKAKNIIPDLIICDIMMPEMNGFELLNELQKDETTNSIPFIFLTAKVEPENTRYGMKLGADDYVLKPFNIIDLLDTINARLKKTEINKKRLNEIQEQITNKIPHELRTPLVPILGYAELIEELDNLDEVKNMVRIIKNSGFTLKERIEKFLLYKDLTIVLFDKEKRDAIKDVPFNINNEVLMLGADMMVRRHNAKERIKINLTPAVLSIKEIYFEKMMNELLDNTLKFSDSGAPVIINGYPKDEYYVLDVKDFGTGMKADEIKSISAFNKFGENKLSVPGFGLGLPIVQKICEICDGKVGIKSRLNEGTQIEIRIPIYHSN